MKTVIMTGTAEILAGNSDIVLFATTTNLSPNKLYKLKKINVSGVCVDDNGFVVDHAIWLNIILSGAGWDSPSITVPKQDPVDIFIDTQKPVNLEQIVRPNVNLTFNLRANLKAVSLTNVNCYATVYIEYE